MANEMASESNEPEVTDAAPATTGRALVPLTASTESGTLAHRNLRPDAGFVIHLIATAAHAPQTRNLRRVASIDGAATYNGAGTRNRAAATPSRFALSRVV